MLKLIQEDVRGLLVWCVCEVIRGCPAGSWAKFTSEQVARNFMRWLETLDTEGLIRRLLSGLHSETDKQLYATINRRADHVTRVNVQHLTGTYWQRYYPHAAF